MEKFTPYSKLTPPWAVQITSEAPDCSLCSWSFTDGEWRVKYVNSLCAKHKRGMTAGEEQDEQPESLLSLLRND